ncbi:MAG TPA: hypothetical protein VM219_08735 [Phycisphaerae bacterium]|nr:hypothetical protein [Phycisphaerae bacterium]
MAVCVAVLCSLIWLGLAFAVTFVVPEFKAIFERFEIEGGLPRPTLVLFEASYLFRNPRYHLGSLWVLALLVPVVLITWAARSGNSSRCRRVLLLLFVLLLGVAACVAISLFLPLRGLIKDVGQR